jgi:hypothetical protein
MSKPYHLISVPHTTYDHYVDADGLRYWIYAISSKGLNDPVIFHGRASLDNGGTSLRDFSSDEIHDDKKEIK